MMRANLGSIGLCVLTAQLLAPLPARAQDASAGLFAREADVFAPGTGLTRLELPADVLRACRADLSDLRLFDATGQPLPFAVVRGPEAAVRARVAPNQPAQVLEAEQRSTGPTERPELVETYVLATPATSDPMRLRLRVEAAELTRSLRVTYLPQAGAPMLLARDTTLFRSAELGEKLAIALGPLGPGRVRVELTGQGEALKPSFEWEGEPVADEPTPLRVELQARSERSEPGRTLVILERPAGVVPSALSLTTDTRSFARQVRVFDAEPNRRLGPLGAARLVRGEGLAQPAALEVPLATAQGSRLEVEIDDGDSPALTALAFAARVAAPTLVFDAPAASGEGPGAVLRFGGGRVRAVRYDLSALVTDAVQGLDGSARLAGLPLGRLGVARDDPRFEAAAPLHVLLGAGASLDASDYAHRRSFDVPPSATGVFRIALTPNDLAAARDDLADLRIVDEAQRQRAYLLVQDDAAREVPLGQIEATRDPLSKTTLYALELPAQPLATEGLTLAFDGAQFDRAFELHGRMLQGQLVTLASGRLTRALGQPDAEITLDFARTPLAGLELTVHDADDAPLTLKAARTRLAMPTLYFAAAPGSYALLVGHPQAEPPHYELASARQALLAVDSAALTPAELEPNPGHGASGTLALLQRPGSVVDVEHYGWVRECTVPGSRDGLARILLAARDLAVLRADLADIRVVDAERRQRPYVLQQDAAEEALAVDVPPAQSRDGKSTWSFALPAQPLPLVALALGTRVPFFDREYRVLARDADGKELTLASGRLTRRVGSDATELVLPLERRRVSSLTLEVRDGADAPLVFDRAELRVPLPALYALVPAGRYAVLLGSVSAAAPSYEVEHQRELVLSVQSSEASLGPLRPNPSHGVRARVESLATSELVLWLAFAAALVALTAFTFRLVRREQGGSL
jgi:hypothetical protein